MGQLHVVDSSVLTEKSTKVVKIYICIIIAGSLESAYSLNWGA